MLSLLMSMLLPKKMFKIMIVEWKEKLENLVYCKSCSVVVLHTLIYITRGVWRTAQFLWNSAGNCWLRIMKFLAPSLSFWVWIFNFFKPPVWFIFTFSETLSKSTVQKEPKICCRKYAQSKGSSCLSLFPILDLLSHYNI